VHFDLARLSPGERVVGFSGLVLFVTSLIPLWSKYEVEFGRLDNTIRTGAWGSVEGVGAAFSYSLRLGIVLGLICVGFVVIRAIGAEPRPRAPLGMIYSGAGFLATILILVAALDGPRGIDPGPGLEISRGPLLFLGPVLAAAVALGGYLHLKAERRLPGFRRVGLPPPPPPPAPPPP
jgi:hypothetical protein